MLTNTLYRVILRRRINSDDNYLWIVTQAQQDAKSVIRVSTPPIGVRSIAISVSVCLPVYMSVCLYVCLLPVRSHISKSSSAVANKPARRTTSRQTAKF